jgi:hypothetical protein
MLTVAIENMDRDIPESQRNGAEALMQLSIALHAANVWHQVEGQESRRTFWRALIDYLFGCINQPGLIDWTRGGIIQRYSLQTPQAVAGGPTASELVEQWAPPNYQSRNVLSAEGWVGAALAEAWLITGDPKMHDLAKEIYDHQAPINVAHGVKQFSVGNWSAWGTFWPSVLAFGWSP